MSSTDSADWQRFVEAGDKPEEAEVLARASAIGRTETVAQAYDARIAGPPPGMNVGLWMRSMVARELAAYEAASEGVALERRARTGAGSEPAARSTTVFSVRLDDEEHAALAERAQRLGARPSVLARNFIRAGLQESRSRRWNEALDRLERLIGEMREVAE